VKSAVQMTGFIRHKRGYKPLDLSLLDKTIAQASSLGSDLRQQNKPLSLPTDPDFEKEWYL
ncbi:hypothetical protein BaRGS_00003943, partial [Batillaria attramentaria]